MTSITHTPDVDLGLRDLMREEAVIFAAISAVLFVTGLISGIVGVYVLAAVTAAIAVGITVAHTSKSMVSPVESA